MNTFNAYGRKETQQLVSRAKVSGIPYIYVSLVSDYEELMHTKSSSLMKDTGASEIFATTNIEIKS